MGKNIGKKGMGFAGVFYNFASLKNFRLLFWC